MEAIYLQLPALLNTLWWPFCRCLALLSAAPIVGDAQVPMSVRVLLSLVLAIVLLPIAHAPAIEAFSLHGILATGQEAVIGLLIGLAFQMLIATILTLGYVISSQMGLSLAVMNDPLNGTASDVVSSLLYILSIVMFFAIDGHLVLVSVLGRSFQMWPIGDGLSFLALNKLALSFSWLFAAALLLALPIIFSTLVVQIGFGLLNRIAPSLNLFSLGFSLVTLFGLFMLSRMLRVLPEYYVRMTEQVLGIIHRSLGL